ncbi:MAG: CoA pyrophosphatase [Bacteroidota bacterium]|nr:CoA pyrophosphatase [Bacteroidota bacterium]
MQSLLKLLKDRINKPLPGIEAQYEMAPITRAKFDVQTLDPNTYRKSAVTLLLYKNNGSYHIPLLKRHEYDGKHSNQVGLPGGKFDKDDGNLMNTALRELQEEIGVKKQDIEVLGALTPLYIPVSNFYVEPFIAIYKHDNIDFTVDQREVKQLIQLDTALLKLDSLIEYDGIVSGDAYKLKTPYFNVEGEIIWGATAMILNEFKKLIV